MESARVAGYNTAWSKARSKAQCIKFWEVETSMVIYLLEA